MNEIKLIVIDVDGTLTDGSIYYGSNLCEIKAFNTKDGLIIKMMPELGIEVLLLTGRTSEATTRRASELGCQLIEGISDKLSILKDLPQCIAFENIAYIGDDLNDYAAMKQCGYRACPADADEHIRTICNYVSTLNGGHGAVRDICENLLRNQEKYELMLQLYGKGENV